MGDEQITLGAVNAGVIQADGMRWVNVNDKRDLLIFRLSFTFWAKSKAVIGVRIEEKIIKRGKFSEVWGFFDMGFFVFKLENVALQGFQQPFPNQGQADFIEVLKLETVCGFYFVFTLQDAKTSQRVYHHTFNG